MGSSTGRQACDALGQGKVGLGISPYQIAMINLDNTLTAQASPTSPNAKS
jgi:hypothetical protein